MSYRLCVIIFILVNSYIADTYALNPLVSKSVNTRTIIGETIEMNCSEYMELQQYNTTVFEWLKNGESLFKTENYNRVSLVNKNQTLRITNITIDDEGTYECATSNQFQSDYSIYTLTVNDSPKLERHNRIITNETRNIGQSITWNCFQLHDKSNYIDQYIWLKNEKILRVEQRNKSLVSGNKNEELRLINITVEDKGIYECRASNKFRIDSSVYILNVDELPNKTFYNNYKSNITRHIGEAVKWYCFYTKIQNVSDLSSTWLKDDKPLQLFKDNTRFQMLNKNFTLRIQKLTLDDAGYYRCVISNEFITGYTNRTLTVVGDPKLLIYRWYSSNITLMRGVSLQLRCNILHSTNNYKTSFSWTKNGNPLELADYNNNKKTLAFHNFVTDENVIYECEAKNYYHKMYSVYKINVVGPKIPRIYKSSNSITSAYLGESVKLFCYVRGMPPPTITWMKNDKPYRVSENNERVLFREYKQQLLFNFIVLEDNGTYKCHVSNKLGSDVSTYTLSINVTDSTSYGRITSSPRSNLMFLIFISLLGVIVVYIRIHCAFQDISGIEEQADLLPYDKEWEFPRNKLKLGNRLASGAFGVVFKADAMGIIDNSSSTVAVKMIKHNNYESHYTKALISELKIMIHVGKHLNVVNLLGACTRDNNNKLLVIVEFCRFGCIREYLLKQRDCFVDQITPDGLLDYNIKNASNDLRENKNGSSYEKYENKNADTNSDGSFIEVESAWYSNYQGDYNDVDIRPLCTHDLMYWSFQVAQGMEYLASRKIFHGDLAARNILLADDHIIKICDFGLAKNKYNYKTHDESKVPSTVKWMAIESLRDQVFSTKSDVWSFGIVLWELFSLASTPYSNMKSYSDLYNRLGTGYRMEQPKYANYQLYNIMLDCWQADPSTRPSFNDLARRVGDLLLIDFKSHYISLNENYVKMNAIRSSPTDFIVLYTRPTCLNGPRVSVNNSDLIPNNAKEIKNNNLELKPMVQCPQ